MLSIIIPTCHRNDKLADCLDRLVPGIQTIAASQYEVIVTDDGIKSTAESLIAEQYPWCRWLQGPRKGPAANRNNGAKHANGEWLVFFDDDCIPDLDVLENYIKATEEHLGCKVFEGRIYVDRPQVCIDEEAPLNETGGVLWSCNFCIEKNLFFEIGAFDENFPYAAAEDKDLHYRLVFNEVKIYFVQGAGVMHPWRVVLDYSIFDKRLLSLKYFFKKHPTARKEINLRYLIVACKNQILSSPKFLFRNKFNFKFFANSLTFQIKLYYYVQFGIE